MHCIAINASLAQCNQITNLDNEQTIGGVWPRQNLPTRNNSFLRMQYNASVHHGGTEPLLVFVSASQDALVKPIDKERGAPMFDLCKRFPQIYTFSSCALVLTMASSRSMYSRGVCNSHIHSHGLSGRYRTSDRLASIRVIADFCAAI